MRNSSQRPVYRSGSWKIDLAKRELRAGATLVPLGSRAFDVVEILVRSAGELVTKDVLLGQVWQGAVVEENALQFHISSIRKAFGRDRAMLQTVSGRGYRLVGDWDTQPEIAPEVPVDLQKESPLTHSRKSNLPMATSELIGRSDTIQHLRNILSAHRVVTLTGPGGIGKSALALEVARSLLPDFLGDVWIVELAPLSNSSLVPSSVIGALGLKVGGSEISSKTVARALASRRVLIVLDNCEHVIEVIALLAKTLLRECPHARLLTTSRETLRIAGEKVFRVPSLNLPAPRMKSSENILCSSAVQLFIARVNASGYELGTNEGILTTVAAICRRLDGIPLAIELAAARVATLGLRLVLSRLDDRFELLTQGHRAAPPRHQTLLAALDWSYQLLPETEKTLLRRLAIFAAGFSLAAAGHIVTDDIIPLSSIEDGVASLVAKSLIAVDVTDVTARHWLLETTRSYARDRLAKSGELDLVARRHAEFLRDWFDRAESELEVCSPHDPLAVSGLVDDVRAALDWAFSPNGDPSVGIAVTSASVSLWFRLTLLAEYRRHLERALRMLNPAIDSALHQEMQLLAALGVTLLVTSAHANQMRQAWERVYEIAERLGDSRYQARALGGLWEIALNRGEFRTTLTLAQEAYEAALESYPASLAASCRMMGVSLHYLGDQTAARHYLEQISSHKGVTLHRSRARSTQIDPEISGRAALARVYWIEGRPDQAVRLAESTTADARASESAFMLCFALTWAAYPVAMFRGDLAAAEAATTLLLATASEYNASIYEMWGRRCQAALLVRKGNAKEGIAVLREVIATFRGRGLTLAYTSTLCDLAEAQGIAERFSDGLAAIDEALARSQAIEERWSISELLRVKAMLLLLKGGPQAVAAAEEHFRRGLDCARRQQALSWELRCAMSLARLERAKGHSDKARDRLAEVYSRFTEGFATADLLAAKVMLDTPP
jgi:predicted ATPase/DNA-binding winged helix-turn-helix (wHTH) protein